MTLENDLMTVQNDITRAKESWTAAASTSDLRRQAEIAEEIRRLEVRADVLEKLIENKKGAEQARQARLNTPEAKREMKQIETMKAEIDRDALKLLKDAGALMRAGLDLFERVDQVEKIITSFGMDDALYATGDKNIREVTLLLSTLRTLKSSDQVPPELEKYFPKE